MFNFFEMPDTDETDETTEPFMPGMNLFPFVNPEMGKMQMKMMQNMFMMQMQMMQTMWMMPMQMMQYLAQNASMENTEHADTKASDAGFKIGNMNVPPEVLQTLMQMEMSPENLEKLQQVLDFVFDMMPAKQTEGK